MIHALVHSLKIITIAATAILVAFGGRSFFDYYTAREADPRLGQPYFLDIDEEDDADSLAAELNDQGLIRSELVFVTEMRVSSGTLQPGLYTLRRGMSVPEIIDVITVDLDSDEEDGEDRAEVRLVETTTIEGWRMEQVAEVWAGEDLQGGYDGFLAATGNISTRPYDFLDDLPEDATLEGYLFPNTYTFASDARPEDVIYLMLDTFDAQFTPEMRRQAEKLGMTIHEVVTIASIVEREAAVAEERPVIASVYLNRLEEGMPLQADPTVVYAIGDEEEWWPELQPNQAEEVDSPYNTYFEPGLPPGPICNPGIASIKAVLYPEEDDYFLYFVAKGDGTHAFTADYDEHLANIDRYQN